MNTNNINSSQRNRNRKFKIIFNLISAVLIPILLAVSTVILAIQQESIAKANRDVDLRIAADQHQQDLALAIDEQRNDQLVAYMHEVSDLLLVNNFSLNKQILTSIVRPKTLATLRQLDTTRKSYLLQFLLECQLVLTSNPSYLSLANANFSNIHMGSINESTNMRYVYFYGVLLDNSSFIYFSFDYSVFSYARLRGVSFNIASFDYVNFDRAQLQDARFDTSTVYKADFSNANMLGASITDKQINSAGSISRAILPNGTIGRNPNLFVNFSCQKLDNQNGIQQNVSVSQYYKWLIQIKRISKLTYFFTGWFDKSNDLRANFTEFNQNGVVLRKYCFGSKDFLMRFTETQLCVAYSWTILSDLLSNYTNQYEYVANKIDSHNETYVVNVDITLGRHGTCRDIHFSVETT